MIEQERVRYIFQSKTSTAMQRHIVHMYYVRLFLIVFVP